MGGAVFPPCFLTWDQTMVEGRKKMTTSRLTQCPWPCSRPFLDTHGQVWVSLLWGHCSFLLGSGTHRVLFVSSKSLFPQSCISSGSSGVGLMVTSSKRAYATPTPFYAQLFVKPPQTAIFFFFYIYFSWGWSCSLSPVQCHKPPPILHQALSLSDLVP